MTPDSDVSEAETQELRAVLDPVWFNTYWIKNALELYEGVSVHSEELNKFYGHFFGLVQKFSLDYAVLGICKLFDKSNARYAKDTVYTLFEYVKKNVTDRYTVRIKEETLINLGIATETSKRLAISLKMSFEDHKQEFLNNIDLNIPAIKHKETMDRLYTYRNKILAHQERLSENIKEESKFLPSLEEMYLINKWTENLCILSISLMTPNIALVPHTTSARMAALNVAAKILDKTFDFSNAEGRRNYDEFYKRL